MAKDTLDPGTQDMLQQRPPDSGWLRQARHAARRKQRGEKQHNIWLRPGEYQAVKCTLAELRRGGWRARLLRWIFKFSA